MDPRLWRRDPARAGMEAPHRQGSACLDQEGSASRHQQQGFRARSLVLPCDLAWRPQSGCRPQVCFCITKFLRHHARVFKLVSVAFHLVHQLGHL